MANAQLMEEELQQSVVLSEEDAEFEEDDVVQDATMADINVSPYPTTYKDRDEHGDNQEAHDEGDQQEDSDVDMELYDDTLSKPRQRGAQEENPTNDEDALHVDEDSESDDNDTHDDDGAFDIDAEGEDEEEEEIGRIRQKHHVKEDSESSGESEELVEEDAEDDREGEEEEEEAEGVGAVKIRPGETDEDSDSVSSESSASDFSDRESIAEWDDPVENDDDGDGDDESDVADSPMCIFCKKAAGHDFSGAIDSSLVCKGCGEQGMFFFTLAPLRLSVANSQ